LWLFAPRPAEVAKWSCFLTLFRNANASGRLAETKAGSIWVRLVFLELKNNLRPRINICNFVLFKEKCVAGF
jgi:hypothetical protein